MNYSDGSRDNIFVLVRIRPQNEREVREGNDVCVRVDDARQNAIILETKPESKVFTFDWVASRGTTQEEIFDGVGKKLVDTCLEGYNCTIFAYGQTGAGKTYTMLGKGYDDGEDFDTSSRGIQPRVLEYLFDRIEEVKGRDDAVEALVKASYFEIYNEQIMDLVVEVREDLKRGVFLEGIAEETITSVPEALSVLRKGASNRHIAKTEVNFESSRSHSVLTLTIENKFHFVDLAGSERQKLTKTSGQRLKEAGNIHKSLTVLGSVINALSEGKNAHVRYRDSKLTFILKDSLGGNSKTTMIANISPASASFSETLSTLKFAQRAKLIKNRASINQESSGSTENLRREISRLRDELGNARNLIVTLESNVRLGMVNGPSMALESTTDDKTGAEDFTKNVLQGNKCQLELEILLRESMNVIYETERQLQEEVDRKEEFLGMFETLCDLHKDNDSKIRALLSLYERKVSGMADGTQPEHLEKVRCLAEENVVAV